MPAITRLAIDPIHCDAELAAFVRDLSGEGAVVSFMGLARPETKTGEAITQLFLDHYPGMTEASLAAIANATVDRFKPESLFVVHRCGAIKPGEAIVFVAASSIHRRTAFLAADYAMDLLKTEAMFWKREDCESGARWVEPTDADHLATARWNH